MFARCAFRNRECTHKSGSFRPCLKTTRETALCNERRHFFSPEIVFVHHHNNHLGERVESTIYSGNSASLSLWSFSRAAHRGLGVCELYFAAQAYMGERIYQYIRMYTCEPHRSTARGERKGQNRTGVLQLLLLMHIQTVYFFVLVDLPRWPEFALNCWP